MEKKFWLSLLIWYTTTACFGIQSRKFLKDESTTEAEPPKVTALENTNRRDSLRVTILCELCFLTGICLCAILRRKEDKYAWKILPRNKLALVFNIGAVHTVGTWMTIKSLQSSGVVTTYLIKACEPLTTMVLARVISRVTFSVQVISAAVVLAMGLVLSAVPLDILTDVDALSGSLRNCFPAIASNLCFSVRSVFTKIQTKQSSDANASLSQWTSIAQFQLISLISLFFLAVFFAVEGLYWLSWEPSIELYSATLVLLVTIGISHAVYSLSSFSVLRHVTPPTHSVLNVMKRIFVLAVSSVISLTVPRATQIVGGALSAVGATIFWNGRINAEDAYKDKDMRTTAVPESQLYPTEMILSTWKSMFTFLFTGAILMVYASSTT
eukprot:gb/GECG01000651.1/.p1 GENE.gb/GECG01000651.1/~~gb/GECG01000651.1/.p1  ORF type:complete len:383 (+),score=19.36 gb/GECG01000651.1/:1-1149(+)